MLSKQTKHTSTNMSKNIFLVFYGIVEATLEWSMSTTEWQYYLKKHIHLKHVPSGYKEHRN